MGNECPGLSGRRITAARGQCGQKPSASALPPHQRVEATLSTSLSPQPSSGLPSGPPDLILTPFVLTAAESHCLQPRAVPTLFPGRPSAQPLSLCSCCSWASSTLPSTPLSPAETLPPCKPSPTSLGAAGLALTSRVWRRLCPTLPPGLWLFRGQPLGTLASLSMKLAQGRLQGAFGFESMIEPVTREEMDVIVQGNEPQRSLEWPPKCEGGLGTRGSTQSAPQKIALIEEMKTLRFRVDPGSLGNRLILSGRFLLGRWEEQGFCVKSESPNPW